METVYTTQERVACDGGVYEGHPKIYLDVSKTGSVVCPYCSKAFVQGETPSV